MLEDSQSATTDPLTSLGRHQVGVGCRTGIALSERASMINTGNTEENRTTSKPTAFPTKLGVICIMLFHDTQTHAHALPLYAHIGEVEAHTEDYTPTFVHAVQRIQATPPQASSLWG